MPTLSGWLGLNGAIWRVRVSYNVTSGTEGTVPAAFRGRVTGMDRLGDRVVEAFRSLSKRYLGAPPGFDATYCIRLGDIGRSWEVRCTAHGARVRAGATRREPDVVIGTDAQTWLDLREGRLSGVEAFSQRRLYARGDLDLAGGAAVADSAGGRAGGGGGVLAAAAVRAGRPRPGGRLRGPLPPPQRPPAAAADPRRTRREAEDLDADDGRRPRSAAPARAG